MSGSYVILSIALDRDPAAWGFDQMDVFYTDTTDINLALTPDNPEHSLISFQFPEFRMKTGGEQHFGLQLVAPATVSTPDRTARIGARLDPTVGVHFDAWSLSVSAGGGVVESTDAGWALDLRAALGLGWDG